MIARENLTRERLNHAARTLLKQQGILEQHGLWIGGREYSPGDRVIARHNDYAEDVDNGTLGTVVAVDPGSLAVTVQTDAGQLRALDHSYASRYLEHAYAITGHAAQGATVTWAAVVGRPEDFTREWAYTVLSRARIQTTLHVIGEPAGQELEREEYAPGHPPASPGQTLESLERAMRKRETEALAVQQLDIDSITNRQGTHAEARSPELVGLQHLRRSGGVNSPIRLQR